MNNRRLASIFLAIFLLGLSLAAFPQTALAADPFMVTNAADSGQGSLRAAIEAANANPGPDTITFDTTAFPVGSPATITLQSTLTLSANSTTIEGDGRVILTRTPTTDRWNCLEIRANHNVIRGLQINGFWVGIQFVRGIVTENNLVGGTIASQRNIIANNEHMGISLDGPGCSGNLIKGNYIGTDSSGTAAGGIQAIGISLDHGAHNNVIGGNTPEERNIISGNYWVGIYMSDTTLEGTSGNQVCGNYVGTNPTGTLAIPNNQGGVVIDQNATRNTVGGTVPGSGNLISGHTGATPHGIRISRTSGNFIYGNILGLTANGTASLENGRDIQLEYGANNNIIGGPEPNKGNVISGNGNAGIMVYESHDNAIQGNFIGTDITGTKAIGPDYAGIILERSANNLIGGVVPGTRNLISGNHYYGVHVYGAASTNNTIAGNYIGTDVSGTLSIGYQNDGVRFGGQSTNNMIGGTEPGARNIISGNLHYGIALQHEGTTGNKIQGNFLGIDFSGTSDLGNGEMGIILDEYVSNTVIGGIAAGSGNIISGNDSSGIQIGNYSSYALVQGNLIGTDITGTKSITNRGYGIMIGGSTHHNTVGGNEPGARNIISGNSYLTDKGIPNGLGVGILSDARDNLITGNYIGVDITGTGVLGNDYGVHIWNAQDNTVSKNVIHNNTIRGVNIDYFASANNTVTQNSISVNGGTSEMGGIWLSNGANLGILPPVITSVTSTTVTGTASAPNGSIIEIFQDSGRQGNIYIGSIALASGNFTFTGKVPATAVSGNLTATVTDPDGNTSIFSAPVENKLGMIEVASIALSSQPKSITANGTSTSTITAEVKDLAGDLIIEPVEVTFSTNQGTLKGQNPVLTQDGLATIELQSELSAKDIVATVKASAGGKTGACAVFFMAGQGKIKDSYTEIIKGTGPITDPFAGIDVSITAEGEHAVTIAEYEGNPREDTTFKVKGGFYDVHLDDISGVESVTIKFYNVTPQTRIYFWTGSAWKQSSNQTYQNGYITVVITASTQPSLTDLSGLVIVPGELEVEIDIKPGSSPNSINPDNKGVIPVAILTTAEFDATTANTTTLRFGPGEAITVQFAEEDVDCDGDIDLILHFRTQEVGLSSNSTEAWLTGETLNGVYFYGSDTIRIVPPKAKSEPDGKSEAPGQLKEPGEKAIGKAIGKDEAPGQNKEAGNPVEGKALGKEEAPGQNKEPGEKAEGKALGKEIASNSRNQHLGIE